MKSVLQFPLDLSAIISVRHDMKDTVWGNSGRMMLSETHYINEIEKIVVRPECRTLRPQKSLDSTMDLFLPAGTKEYISQIEVQVDPSVYGLVKLHVNGIEFSPDHYAMFTFNIPRAGDLLFCEQTGRLTTANCESMTLSICNMPAGHAFVKGVVDVAVTSHAPTQKVTADDETRITTAVYPGAYMVPFDGPVNYMAFDCFGGDVGDEIFMLSASNVVARFACTNDRVIFTFTNRYMSPEQRGGYLNGTDYFGQDSVNFSTPRALRVWTTSATCTIGEIDYSPLIALKINSTGAPVPM
jgi:hypothetical protein